MSHPQPRSSITDPRQDGDVTESDDEDTTGLDAFLQTQYFKDATSQRVNKYSAELTNSSIKGVYQQWQLLSSMSVCILPATGGNLHRSAIFKE